MIIKVDHSKFENAANAIDTYIRQYRNRMNNIDDAINGKLASAWKGEDYTQFRSEWEELSAKEAISEKMITALQNYSDSLHAASKHYLQAQTDAINRAKKKCTIR